MYMSPGTLAQVTIDVLRILFRVDNDYGQSKGLFWKWRVWPQITPVWFSIRFGRQVYRRRRGITSRKIVIDLREIFSVQERQTTETCTKGRELSPYMDPVVLRTTRCPKHKISLEIVIIFFFGPLHSLVLCYPSFSSSVYVYLVIIPCTGVLRERTDRRRFRIFLLVYA